MNSKDLTGGSYRASPPYCLPLAYHRDIWKVLGLVHNLGGEGMQGSDRLMGTAFTCGSKAHWFIFGLPCRKVKC